MEQRNCEEVISENADPWAWNSSREVLTTAWHYFKAFSVTFGPSLSADSWEQSRCFSSAPVVTAAFSHSLLQGQIKDTKTDLPQTKARGPFSPNPFCERQSGAGACERLSCRRKQKRRNNVGTQERRGEGHFSGHLTFEEKKQTLRCSVLSRHCNMTKRMKQNYKKKTTSVYNKNWIQRGWSLKQK